MEDWREIVEAAGIELEGKQPYELYHISGRIIYDSFVAGVKRQLAPAFNGKLPKGLTASLVGSFTDEQKAALRERVLKKS